MNTTLQPATLIRRINRFVASVQINGTQIEVYVPNTGRMSELALPGAECLLAESFGKFRYKLLYIIRNGFPVMIDSGLSNSLFAELLESGKVPSYENFRLVKREPVYGKHRFDFALADTNNTCYAELKSCTLFYKDVASFPDAVSERASAHIRELASTTGGRLIILILNDSASVFVPNYHTDYAFYTTLKKYSPGIQISAFRISYSDDLVIDSLTPVPVLIPEVSTRGYFLLLITNDTGNNYLYISQPADNVFDSVRSFRNSLRTSGEIISIKGKIRTVKDYPVAGDLLPVEESFRLIKEQGGIEIDTGPLPGGRLFIFTYNPSDMAWFHDHILDLRFAGYSALT